MSGSIFQLPQTTAFINFNRTNNFSILGQLMHKNSLDPSRLASTIESVPPNVDAL